MKNKYSKNINSVAWINKKSLIFCLLAGMDHLILTTSPWKFLPVSFRHCFLLWKTLPVYSITMPHGMCYSHFSNGVPKSKPNMADYRNGVCTYRGANQMPFHFLKIIKIGWISYSTALWMTVGEGR